MTGTRAGVLDRLLVPIAPFAFFIALASWEFSWALVHFIVMTCLVGAVLALVLDPFRIPRWARSSA